jgi:hypothetical protein
MRAAQIGFAKLAGAFVAGNGRIVRQALPFDTQSVNLAPEVALSAMKRVSVRGFRIDAATLELATAFVGRHEAFARADEAVALKTDLPAACVTDVSAGTAVARIGKRIDANGVASRQPGTALAVALPAVLSVRAGVGTSAAAQRVGRHVDTLAGAVDRAQPTDTLSVNAGLGRIATQPAPATVLFVEQQIDTFPSAFVQPLRTIARTIRTDMGCIKAGIRGCAIHPSDQLSGLTSG